MPYLRRLGTLDAVRVELETQSSRDRSRAAVLLEPLAYARFLLGDVDGALAAVDAFADLVSKLGPESAASGRLG